MGIISYAQNFEDVMLWRALGYVQHGFYIDIGAQHPITDSVSKAFYEHDWRGIHVEPTAEHANLLRVDRPDESVIQAIVSGKRGVVQFYEFPGTGLSTARKDIAEEHRNKLGFEVVERLTTAVTLDDVLELTATDDIHWLKIDVEGFEKEVLSGWRRSLRRPWIVVVEAALPLTQVETFSEWEPLLREKGYALVFCDGLNRYYLCDAHTELRSHFRYPPNVFDGFQLSGTSSASFTDHVRDQLEQAHRKEVEASEDTFRQSFLGQLEEQQREHEARERALKGDYDAQVAALRQASEQGASQLGGTIEALRDRYEAVRRDLLERESVYSERLEAQRREAQAREDDLRQSFLAQLVEHRREHEARERALKGDYDAQVAALRQASEQGASQLGGTIEALRDRYEAVRRDLLERESVYSERLEAQRREAQAREDDLRESFVAQMEAHRREAQLREVDHRREQGARGVALKERYEAQVIELRESSQREAEELRAALEAARCQCEAIREELMRERMHSDQLNADHRELQMRERRLEQEHEAREVELGQTFDAQIAELREASEREASELMLAIEALRNQYDTTQRAVLERDQVHASAIEALRRDARSREDDLSETYLTLLEELRHDFGSHETLLNKSCEAQLLELRQSIQRETTHLGRTIEELRGRYATELAASAQAAEAVARKHQEDVARLAAALRDERELFEHTVRELHIEAQQSEHAARAEAAEELAVAREAEVLGRLAVQDDLAKAHNEIGEARSGRDITRGILGQTQSELKRVRALLSQALGEVVRARHSSEAGGQRHAGQAARVPTAGEKSTRADRPRANAWCSALTWRMRGIADGPQELSLTHVEVAQAMAEMGYDVVTETAPVLADMTAVAAPPDAFVDTGKERALLIGLDSDASVYPGEWIDNFNAELSGVACTSRLGLKALLDQGLAVPAAAIGMGVDHWDRISAAPTYAAPGKKFRFLHVSSGERFTGLDLLIDSFGYSFSNRDDVSLIVAPTGAMSPDILSLLAQLRGNDPRFPDVTLIENSLSAAELKALYMQCDVLVAPNRAGGFCLPIAQAFLSGLPVIVTAWGGHRDYCDESNSWLIDFHFRRADPPPHSLLSSVWAEPAANSLDEALWMAYRASSVERNAKASAGRELIMEHFTWKDTAVRLAALGERSMEALAGGQKARMGLLTTWNTKCGIATYAAHLTASIPPDEFVIFAARQDLLGPDQRNCTRSWNIGKDSNGLREVLDKLLAQSVDSILIQFNYGFFNHFELQEFIESCLAKGVVVFIELHSTVDPYGEVENFRLADLMEGLRKCHRILVHSVADVERLRGLGLVDNVTLFPHGVMKMRGTELTGSKTNTPPLIASFGFCLPHKGLVELVEAVSLLKQWGRPLRLRMVNALFPLEVSAVELARIREAIERLDLWADVELYTEFLEDNACLRLLAESDLVVNPLQRTGESASGSVRYALSAGALVAVTPLAIFDDLGDAVFRLPGFAPEQLAEGIADALRHIEERSETFRRFQDAARRWVDEHDFARVSIRLMRMASALNQSRTGQESGNGKSTRSWGPSPVAAPMANGITAWMRGRP